MPIQIKIDTVATLTQRFQEATNIFITDYAGLNVEQMTALRKQLRDGGVKYIIAKNTLLRIAAKDSGYDDMTEHLVGPTAIAFSSAEPNVPAKILYDTFKENKDLQKPEIKAFYIDKQPFAGSDAERIANLPSREQLLSQLIADVESPIAGLVGTLDGILRELVGTIDAMARQQGDG